jgi:hypothetical protein
MDDFYFYLFFAVLLIFCEFPRPLGVVLAVSCFPAVAGIHGVPSV